MAKLTTITGDATRPANEGEQFILIPHVVNDIGRWSSGFVNAITARWGQGPRQAYLNWADGKELKDIQEFVDLYAETHDEPEARIATPESFRGGAVQRVSVGKHVIIANMVGQHGVVGDDPNRPPVRYLWLMGAMRRIKEFILTFQSSTQYKMAIHCPKFGSDLAGGEWKAIEAMIQEIWVDEGIDVTVYEFDPNA